jgi:hypothetical protein
MLAGVEDELRDLNRESFGSIAYLNNCAGGHNSHNTALGSSFAPSFCAAAAFLREILG